MAIVSLTDALILRSGFNYSGVSNKVTLERSVEMLDATVFGNTTKVNAPGLFGWKVSASGFWQAAGTTGIPDPQVTTELGAASPNVVTIAASTADNEKAWLGKDVVDSYEFFGEIGVLNPFSLSTMPGSYLTPGTVLLPASSRSASSGNGTARQLGAVASTQRIAAALHVTAFNGTTLTVTIASDNASGFPSAATQITFTAATGVTSEWKELAGANTDDWWRASWTFTGTSFTAHVAMGIV